MVALGVAGALAFSPVVASADSLTAVDLDCGDGYPLHAVVTLATLSDIQDGVNAMVNFPSGITCLLSTSIVTDPFATPTTDPFIVGGGRYIAPSQFDGLGSCWYNFGVSAHQDADGATHGSSHVVETTQSPTDPSTCNANGGHVKADVECVMVGSDMNGTGIGATYGNIEEATGDYALTVRNGATSMKTNATAPNNLAPNGQISHRFDTMNLRDCTPEGGAYPVQHGKIHLGSK